MADAKSPKRRVLRKNRTGANPFLVGALVLVLSAIVVYFGFTKSIPFTHDFRLAAVFESANSIRPDSPVRIAGVNVGKVTEVTRYKNTDAAVVKMEIQDKGLPIHRDAAAKIRPRIFLEGNFFVDLTAGSPPAPELRDDGTIPVTRTATPVQLDEVLTALQTDAREDLKLVLDELGRGLTRNPPPSEDVDQDPIVQGKTAARALNGAYTYAGPAQEGVAQVNQALLGTEPGDLPNLISGLQRTAAGLGRNEEQLKDLITNFNTTVAAFADESGNLQQTIRLLPPILQTADSTFDALNEAFPSVRAFSLELIPGVEQTPATIDASYPFIRQSKALVQPEELGGLTDELQATIPDLAELTDQTLGLLPKVDLVNRCVTDIVLPTGDVVIQDGPFTTGLENYKGFWWALVALAGEGQNFDGNGQYVRFQVGGGTQTVSTGSSSLSGDTLFGNAVDRPLGTRPAYTGKRPPYRPDVPCFQNEPPDLNGAAAATGNVEQVVATNPGTLLSGGEPSATPLPPGLASTLGGVLPAYKKLEEDKRTPYDKQRGVTRKPTLAEKLADRLNPFRGTGKANDGGLKKSEAVNGGRTKPSNIKAEGRTPEKGTSGTETVVKEGGAG